MATIDDRVTRVQFLLGNRTDIDERIIEWLGDAYLDLGMSVPFDELEDTADDVFIVGTTEYTYPETARAVKALTGFVNNNPYPLYKRDIRVIERFPSSTASVKGVPAIWAPFNDSIVVRPSPNLAYPFVWKFWAKPVLDDPVEDTVLLMPDDWLEIVDYMAAYRGHMALDEAEKARAISVLLHGDTRHPDEVGLIKAKLRRNAAENVVNDYALAPQIRPYGNVK